MNDRELLEAAAKAAVVEVDWRDTCLCYSSSPYSVAWNPLTDDGDAFRLAVKLNIWPVRCKFKNAPDLIAVQPGEAYWDSLADEEVGDDPLAATRRAIVRAAAQMGLQGG